MEHKRVVTTSEKRLPKRLLRLLPVLKQLHPAWDAYRRRRFQSARKHETALRA